MTIDFLSFMLGLLAGLIISLMNIVLVRADVVESIKQITRSKRAKIIEPDNIDLS